MLNEMRGGLKIFLGIGLGAIGMAILYNLGVVVMAPTPIIVTQTPTARPTSTIAARPTVTPLPTLEPRANDGAYLREVEDKVAGCAYYFETWMAEVENLRDNPALAYDEVWIVKTAGILAGVQDSCGSFETIQPVPAKYRKAQAYLNSASVEFNAAVDAFVYGVDNQDNAAMQECGNRLEAATDYVVQALDLLSGPVKDVGFGGA